MSCSTSYRGWLSALAVAFVAAGLAAAGDPDLLQDAKRRREVAAQKVESDVRQGLVESVRLQRTEPARAAALLRDLLRQVDGDDTMTPGRRAVLRQRIRSMLRGLEDQDSRQASRDLEYANRKAGVAGRRADDERRSADAYRLSRQMQQVNELRRAGRFDEANRLAAEIAASNPDNPAAIAARRTAAISERVADARGRGNEQNDRFLGVGREIEKSTAPPLGDAELPADWKEKSMRRSPAMKLTEKEKAILKALDTPIQAELNGTFNQAIDYLQTVMGQPIVVDDQALKEVNVNSDTPVNLRLRKVSARSVLKKLLAEHNLAYIVKDQTIFVTSAARARETMTTRAYYIGDLVNLGNATIFPLLNQLQAIQSINTITEMIQGQVDPSSWRINGGQGSVTFDPVTMSLIVRQTAEVHMMLGGSLK